MVKRVLQSVALLHNKEAKNLASASLQTLESKANAENLNALRDKWFEFIGSYDDSFMKKLESFGVKSGDDLVSLVDTMAKVATPVGKDRNYDNIASVIVASLVPSIASSMNDELANISYELRANPELIESEGMQKDIKKFVTKRVKLDKEEFRSKIAQLNKILDAIEENMKFFVDQFGLEDQNFEAIRKNLKAIGNYDEYKTVKDKLENVATSLESKFKDFFSKLKENELTINSLKAQIRELQAKLERSEEESRNDFLTGLSNKKTLEAEIARIEAIHKRYDVEYSICFFDIDNFKTINDTYGHDAGDAILRKVGEILRENSREVDIVGRFGGEEFVIVLPRTGLDEAQIFAEKILKAVAAFQFIYKKSRFNITMSCGVSARSKRKDEKDTLKAADELLYKAKNSGKNNVQL